MRGIIVLVVALALVSTAGAFGFGNWAFWDSANDNAGSIPTNWYSVTDAAIEMCSKWGGYDEPEGTTITGDFKLSQLTYTVQGSRTRQLDNTSLYEFSWYIQPITGEINYTIEIINATGHIRKLDESKADFLSGASGYHAFYSTEEITKIRMNHDQGTITVDVVCVDIDGEEC